MVELLLEIFLEEGFYGIGDLEIYLDEVLRLNCIWYARLAFYC